MKTESGSRVILVWASKGVGKERARKAVVSNTLPSPLVTIPALIPYKGKRVVIFPSACPDHC